jgi:hypothetical protein
MRWVVGAGAAGSVEGLVACPEGVQLADALPLVSILAERVG